LQKTDENVLPRSVRVSFDQPKLTALLEIEREFAHEAQSVPGAQIVKGLEALGIKKIDTESIPALLSDLEIGKRVVVATGVPPERGRDGEIEYHFDTQRKRPAAQRDRPGRVDHRELNLIQNVKKGDTLATATRPGAGVAGRNVFGEGLPALPGKPAQIRCGRGVQLVENGSKAVAAHDGMVTFDDGKIGVVSVYTVTGDVDYETGNIRFLGDIVVGRHVKEDFKVESTGNVRVYGNVDRGDIEAGGSVEVSGGILGKEGVAVRAQEDITAGFADNANIVAGGTVTVRGEVFRSNIRAGTVVVEGVKGAVIGGTISASHEIRVGNAGNPKTAPRTVLQIEPDPTLTQQLENAQKELAQLRRDAKAANERYTQMLELKRRYNGVLTERGESMLQESSDKLDALEERKREVTSHIDALQAELHGAEDCRIRILDKAFPGTCVIIHGAVLDIKDTVTRITFANENGTVVGSP
jgi:uncharacterized protein (DUF342 family)